MIIPSFFLTFIIIIISITFSFIKILVVYYIIIITFYIPPFRYSIFSNIVVTGVSV